MLKKRSCLPEPTESAHGMNYDIAIIGSGIACTMTLLELAKLLNDASPAGKGLQIAVIEKEAEFWNGIPYGRRSSVNSLVITSLREFVHEPEKTSFIRWLEANKSRWLNHLKQHGGVAGARWIKANQRFMKTGDWDAMFLPRFVYGLYNSEKLSASLGVLKQRRLAEVTLIQAEAVDLAPASVDPYVITLEQPDGKFSLLSSERVVVAIGSPPASRIQGETSDAHKPHTYINDIYCPSEEVILERLHEVLAAIPEKQKRNILILGSNASSLETLYLINHRPELKALANSVVVISRSGTLPHKICDQPPDFEFTELGLLKQKRSFNALDLIAAIKKDVQRAEDASANIADLFHAASAVVGELIKQMDVAEQEQFFCRHGMTFSKLMRRAGREYREAADELAADGKLVMVKGEFRELSASAGDGFVSATYARSETEASVTHPLPFPIVINCGGFEELNKSSCRLIANLVGKKICKVNSTNRGFQVNETLEANRNLYVIGPLIGGNFNNKIRFWHAESAPRISGLAKLLAGCLFDSLSASSQPSRPAVPVPAQCIPQRV